MQTDVVMRRIVALIVDGIVLFVVSAVVLTLLDIIGLDMWDVETSEFSFSATTTFGGTLTSSILSLVYKALMEGRNNGQTLGKQALGIRVVQAGTGQPISMESAVIRAAFWVVPFWLTGSSGQYGILGLIGSIWLVAGLISLIASPLRQRLGDRVANTVVVRVGANQVAQPQFASASRSMPVVSTQPTHGTTGEPEAWLSCDYCGSRFPRSRARPGIWQEEAVLFCPNCGGPVQSSNDRP